MPANMLLPTNMSASSTSVSPADYVTQLTQRLQSAFSTAAWNRDCAHNQQKQLYDRGIKHTPYVPGDLVWLNDPTTAKQKLAPHWKGPFEILECLGTDGENPGVTYRIRYLLDQSDKTQIVHYNRLRPYKAPVPKGGTNSPAGDIPVQPQIPQLTALSGALPFTASKSAAEGSWNVQGRSPATSSDPQVCQPPPLNQSRPHSHSPLSPSPRSETVTTSPSGHVVIHQSDIVPSTPHRVSGVSRRCGRRQVVPPRYLKDYVLN